MTAVLAVFACSEPVPSPSTIDVESEWSPPDQVTGEAVEPPEGAIVLAPGESIQEAVDAAPSAATFFLQAGVHRGQSVVPRDGDTFLGEPGAVLSGALELSDFEAAEAGLWVHEGIDHRGEESGRCREQFQACGLPEDLFLDGEVLQRVLNRDEVTEGSWYLDHESGRLYTGSDPEGGVYELSVTPAAISSDAEGVTIRGLTVERYANPAQSGAIGVGRDWTVDGVEVRHNHGVGIKTATGLTVTDAFVHHNGQLGIGGGGVGVTITGSEIAENGILGFSPHWEAGGVKMVFTYDLEVSENLIYSNWGPGVWTDASDDETVIRGNRILGNEHAGVKLEISGSALVEDNELAANGQEGSERWAGILIRESGPVEVRNNRIHDNVDPLTILQDDDRQNPTENHLQDVVVVDNDIAFDAGRLGFRGDIGEEMASTELRFRSNRYYGASTSLSFLAFGSEVGLEEWQNLTADDSVVLDREEMP